LAVLVVLVVLFFVTHKMFVLQILQDLFDLQIAEFGLFQKAATRLIILLLLAVEAEAAYQIQLV
jgi:hypothetical protein